MNKQRDVGSRIVASHIPPEYKVKLQEQAWRDMITNFADTMQTGKWYAIRRRERSGIEPVNGEPDTAIEMNLDVRLVTEQYRMTYAEMSTAMVYRSAVEELKSRVRNWLWRTLRFLPKNKG